MSIALHATHLKQAHVERIMFHSILSFHLVLCPLKSGRAPSSIHWLRHRGKGFVCLCATCLLRTSRVSNLWLAPYKSTLVVEPGPLGSGSNPLPYFHSIYNITIHIDSIFTYPSTSCSSSLAWSLWPKVRRSLTSKMPPQPTPRAAASQASQASQPAAYDGTSLKDTYIPVFDGQPSSYQEWRKRIGIYHLKMKLQKRTAESILNIIGSLQGTAWKLVVTWTRSTKKELLRIWWNFSMMPSGMTAGFVFHRILMPTSLISPGNQVRPCCRTSRSMTRSLGRFKNVESKSLMKPKDGYFSRNPVSPRSNSRWSSPRPRRWRNSGSKKPCFCWVSPGIFFPCPGFFSWSVLFSVPYIYPATSLPCCMLFAAFWSWNLSFCMFFAAFGSWNLPCCMLFAAFWSWNFLFCMLFTAFGRRNLPFSMLFAAFARRNLSVCVLFAEFGSWNLPFCCVCCCYVCCCYVCWCAVCWKSCMFFAAFGSWNLPCCMLFAAFWSWNFLFCMLFTAFGRRNLPFSMLFAAFARRNLSVCVLFAEFGSWNLPFCCVCCCYVCCCYVCCCAVCCCNVCCCFFAVIVVTMFVVVMFVVAMAVVVMVVVMSVVVMLVVVIVVVVFIVVMVVVAVAVGSAQMNSHKYVSKWLPVHMYIYIHMYVE